jgi:hypothetical protein
LRFYNSMSESAGPTYAGKENESIDDLRFFSGQWLLLEDRQPDQEFVNDTTAITTPITVIRYRTETQAYDAPIKINLAQDASIQQLQQQISDTLEIERQRLVVLKLIASELVVVPLRAKADEPAGVEALVNRDIEAGMTVYAEEVAAGGDASSSAVAERFEIERNQVEIRYNVPGERMPTREINIDKRRPLGDLKREIAATLRLELNEFKMCDNAMSKNEFKDVQKPIARSNLFDGSAVFITLGKPMVLGEHNITLFRYDPSANADQQQHAVQSDSSSSSSSSATTIANDYSEIGKLVVQGSWNIEQIAAAAASRFGDCTLSDASAVWRIKVGKRAGRVIARTVALCDVILSLKDGTELAIQARHSWSASDITDQSLLLQVRRWSPREWLVSKHKHELLITKQTTVHDLKLLLAEQYSQAADMISVARAPANVDHLDGVQVALLSWNMPDHCVLGRSPWYLKDGECLLWKDRSEPDAIEIDPALRAAAEGRGGSEIGVRIFTPYDDDDDDDDDDDTTERAGSNTKAL